MIDLKPIGLWHEAQNAREAVCHSFPVGSRQLQSLLRVNKSFKANVYEIYRRNVESILGGCSGEREPLNCILWSTRLQYAPTLQFSSEVVSKVQQSITKRINDSGVPCPKRHLALEEIPHMHQAFADLNLTKAWVHIRREIRDVPWHLAKNASAQDIRTWMLENQDLLQHIAKLNLSGTDLTSIPPEIALFTGLEVLFLQRNKISELPKGIFDKLDQLQELRLTDNQISKIPRGIFDKLGRLKELWLDDNQISELLPGLFNPLTGLHMLNLDRNQISELHPEIFSRLAGLQVLSLSYNEISELPQGVFGGLTQLKVLLLSDNQIRELPQGIFNGLAKLERLFLGNNPTSKLKEGIFEGLAELQELKLSGIPIRELPLGIFAGLHGLKTLFLMNSEIKELPEGIFDGLDHLQETYCYGRL